MIEYNPGPEVREGLKRLLIKIEEQETEQDKLSVLTEYLVALIDAVRKHTLEKVLS